MTTMKRQSGFTLVEIAIVLVIVGLLLGGILKGQELINSARVRNLADQNAAVQAAYYGFIDRYRQIPGDWPAAAATTGIGVTIVSPTSANAGNGRVDDGDWDEASGVWEQLAGAGFIAGNYSGGGTAANYTDGTRAPVNAFNGSVLLGRMDQYQDNGTAVERLAFSFGNQIPAKILRELDVKLDDGRPLTGILRVSDTATGGWATLFTSVAACTAGTAPNIEWDVATDSQDCGAVSLY